MSVTKLAQGGTALSGGAFDKKGVFHLCDSQTGAVYRVDNEELVEMFNTHGQPTAVDFDPVSGAMHICDLFHQSILRVEGFSEDGGGPVLSEVVKEFNRIPLQGPHSLAFDREGSLYFTDGGALGQSTLAAPSGSVFAVSCEHSVMQPMALSSLAQPSGLCLSSTQKCVYVAETLHNRLLRFAQRPKGVFHASVFRVFSGGMGPTALTSDSEGNIYVAHYDFRGNTDKGVITVLRPDGEVSRVISIPGPEITGLALHPKNSKLLYVTEASQNAVFVCTL